MDKSKRKVNAIKNGTVIDHITPGRIMKVLDILNLTGDNSVMIGMNLISKKVIKKDIVKIENRVLSEEEVNSISLISPKATLIIIENFEVVKKVELQMPASVEKLIVCPNPKCITNIEDITSKFSINDEKKTVRCHYCEKKYSLEELKIKI